MSIPYAALVADPEYLTRQEAADLLRVDVQTIDRYANAGRLTRLRVGPRRTLFRSAQVRALIERGTENDEGV